LLFIDKLLYVKQNTLNSDALNIERNNPERFYFIHFRAFEVFIDVSKNLESLGDSLVKAFLELLSFI
jgi:hypothetical protein